MSSSERRLDQGVPSVRDRSSLVERFGPVLTNDGIAAIPTSLFRYRGALEISPSEAWLLATLIAHSWTGENPFPSLRQVAARAGIEYRSVQRTRASLCAKGLVAVAPRYSDSGRQIANEYDLTGTFAKLEQVIAAQTARTAGPRTMPGERKANSFLERFGPVICAHGITMVPHALFEYQHALGLSPQHCCFICYVLGFRYGTALPYPSLTRMSKRVGRSRRDLQEIRAFLVDSRYMQVFPNIGNKGQEANSYDLQPLLTRLSQLVTETAMHQAADRGQSRKDATRQSQPAASGPTSKADTGFAGEDDVQVAPGDDSRSAGEDDSNRAQGRTTRKTKVKREANQHRAAPVFDTAQEEALAALKAAGVDDAVAAEIVLKYPDNPSQVHVAIRDVQARDGVQNQAGYLVKLLLKSDRYSVAAPTHTVSRTRPRKLHDHGRQWPTGTRQTSQAFEATGHRQQPNHAVPENRTATQRSPYRAEDAEFYDLPSA